MNTTRRGFSENRCSCGHAAREHYFGGHNECLECPCLGFDGKRGPARPLMKIRVPEELLEDLP